MKAKDQLKKMNNYIFKTKIDIGLTIIVWISLVAGALIGLYSTIIITFQNIKLIYWPILTILFCILLFLFIGWIWIKTEYHIINNILIIYCGPFKKKIDISSIKKITYSNNPISSPALSTDRIEIKLNSGYKIYISPKNKILFIDILKKINDSIIVP